MSVPVISVSGAGSGATAAGAAAVADGASHPASPYEMKSQDKTSKRLTPTVRAYENQSFLSGNSGRMIRILSEFQEPQERLRQHNIKGTILFFGSARSMSLPQYEETMTGLRAEHAAAVAAGASDKQTEIAAKIERFEKVRWMCPFTDIVEDLARRLTEWSMSLPKLKQFFSKQPDYLTGFVQPVESNQPLVVCTGGGPGIMESANRGARSVDGALSMGMGISLPFEKGLNPFVTPSLAFEYHYFFSRKFWMMYTAKALIVGPGGFGTLDELFELLTLRQTGKLPDMPIVLLGTHFWKTIINWQALADFGTVSQQEIDRLFFADDATSAFEYITSSIEDCADKYQAAAATPGIAAHHARFSNSPDHGGSFSLPTAAAGAGAAAAGRHHAVEPVTPAFALAPRAAGQ